MNRVSILLVAAFVSGCSPPVLRGNFTLLSTEDLSGKYDVLSNQELTGKACFNLIKPAVFIGEGVFDEAVRDALAGQPEGTLLIDAEFVDDGTCVNVTGLPAKLK